MSSPAPDCGDPRVQRLSRRQRAILVAVLMVSLFGKIALRLAVTGTDDYWRSGYSFYHRMADTFLRTGILTFGGDEQGRGGFLCFRPPLYPLFIASVSRLSNDSAAAFITVQAAVSTLTVLLVFWITRRLTGTRAALASAALIAFFPYSFAHDTQQQENALHTLLSLVGIGFVLRGWGAAPSWGWFFAGGVATGLAVLTRMSHLPCGILLALLPWWGTVWTRPERVLRSAALLVGLGLTLTPWLLRNHAVSGRWAFTSESGFALARAHNASTFEYYPYRASIDRSWVAFHEAMTADQKQERDELASDEFALNAWYRSLGMQFVREHPVRSAGEGIVKVLVNFLGILSPLQGTLKNLTYSLSYWGLTLLALAGLRRLQATPFLAIAALFLIAHSAVSFVFWAHTSHRAFLDPLWAIAAGVGAIQLWDWRTRSRGAEEAGDL